MKRTEGLAVALALGMMSHSVMAKTLNVVTSFLFRGYHPAGGGRSREGDDAGRAGR